MIIRVRLETGPRIRKAAGKNRHVAAAIAALMWPAVLTTYVFALWALGAQIRVAGAFAIAHGVFSHWQVWFATAFSLHLATLSLTRYGEDGDFRSLTPLFTWLSNFAGRRASE